MIRVRTGVQTLVATALLVASSLVAAPAAVAATGSDTLAPGARLQSGDSLQVPNADVQLDLTGDGDLQLVVGGQPTWSTGTGGHPGATLSMQTDGNLVLRAASGRALWASWTQAHAGARAVVLPSGVFGVVAADQGGLWWSGVAGGELQSGQGLGAGAVLASPSGRLTLNMQTDGNLVLRRDGRAVWASWTQGNAGATVTMQTDGNVVLRAATGRALWATWTRPSTGASLRVLDSGVLAVYSSGEYPLWWQDRTLGSTLCALTPQDPNGTLVTRWDPTVLCVLAMLGQPAGELSDVDTVITYESSGDPNAINLYDINAQEGHPSIGLVQVIKPTFDEWKSPLLPDDLYNPAANVYAGMNYAIHRYGSIHNIPGLVSLRNGGRYKGYIVVN